MKTIKESVESTVKIKKSIFTARLYPVKNKKEAKKIIEEVSNKYSDATHNCTAYIVSDSQSYDDDGEPSGTAGKPMINVLEKNNLENILAIVTRYFGGIKLGAGGLVRAYSHSVLEAINHAEIVEIKKFKIYEFIFDYKDIKNIEGTLRKSDLNIINKEYDSKVKYYIASNNLKLIENINEKFHNNLEIKELGIEYLEV
ncbi:YigZ family protein [Methanobrevibacter sp. 87.7]|uniref:YigZ family protein n=1 Tax=Methanobrevibacter sp. 87.7 TaxID=387957 RepID=UPI000B50B010|nr:YigZ family protein [Methanobrevibacter sp. 87.7]OWT33595.1 YigZ family protein [Methanobrevibacter sp. 87.7]